MSATWLVSAACLAVVLVLAMRRTRARHRDRPAAATDALASRVGAQCLLCKRPLPCQLVTREEVVARVEARIAVETAAVSRLLKTPPSPAWVGLFRP